MFPLYVACLICGLLFFVAQKDTETISDPKTRRMTIFGNQVYFFMICFGSSGVIQIIFDFPK